MRYINLPMSVLIIAYSSGYVTHDVTQPVIYSGYCCIDVSTGVLLSTLQIMVQRFLDTRRTSDYEELQDAGCHVTVPQRATQYNFSCFE